MSKSQDISILEIFSADLPRVRALAERIWPECFAGILPEDRIAPMVAEIYADQTLQDDIALRHHRYFLAQVDGQDVGYVSAYREGQRLWIKKLYLLDSCRGLGLGKKLVATAVQNFPAATSLGLYVNDGNAPAIGFYRAQGFEVESHVPVQMGPFAFKDFVMVKPLA